MDGPAPCQHEPGQSGAQAPSSVRPDRLLWSLVTQGSVSGRSLDDPSPCSGAAVWTELSGEGGGGVGRGSGERT